MTAQMPLPIIAPTNRFKVLERPIAFPYKCNICGRVDKPVLDFGANTYDGAIVFCLDCFKDAAETLGYSYNTRAASESEVVANYLLTTNQELVSHEFLRVIADTVINFNNDNNGVASVLVGPQDAPIDRSSDVDDNQLELFSLDSSGSIITPNISDVQLVSLKRPDDVSNATSSIDASIFDDFSLE